MTAPQRQACTHALAGFTLIEALVVCAIVAILATVAYPSLVEHARAGRRVDAQRALEEASLYLRRRYSTWDTHAGARLPDHLRRAPREGSTAYDIVMVEDNAVVDELTVAHGFTLRAVRAAGMAHDRCGDLELSHTGSRRLINADAGARLPQCFKGG